MRMDFIDKVVVVTGAGRGLGRAHALEFARRGAKVVVNDPGGAVDGTGSGNTAQSVVNEIKDTGGDAMADTASVADIQAANSIIDSAVHNYGTVDILVNNAGILRDKTFANMTMRNFQAVLDVHLMGTIYTTKAVLYPCSESAPNGIILRAQRGQFSIAEVCVNDGIDLGSEVTYQDLLEHVDEILDNSSLHPVPPRVPYRSH